MTKLLCRIFGHDFGKKFEEVYHCAMSTTFKDNCSRCGIRLSDVYHIHGNTVGKKICSCKTSRRHALHKVAKNKIRRNR